MFHLGGSCLDMQNIRVLQHSLKRQLCLQKQRLPLTRLFTTYSRRYDANAAQNTSNDQPTAVFGTVGNLLKMPVVNPAESYKETSERLHDYGTYLLTCMPKYIQKFSIWKDELTIMVAPSAVRPVMYFLRDHTPAQFKSVVDVCGVDFPSRENRFEVVYNMLSVRHNARIRVKTYAGETTPVPSIVDIFQGVNWYEREAYDMYGIFFVGHPDLRRILTDYGFEGHPLRKDFPLTGYTEVRYDEQRKRVVYENLELTQAFRNFDTSTPWESVGEGDKTSPDTYKLPTPKPEEKKEEKK